MELESIQGPLHERTPEPDNEKGENTPLITTTHHPYPLAVFFIVVNEFCERFSYYGMRAILTLFLRNILLYTEDDATVIFHSFIVICYITPFLGAYVSDAHLGKFKTILYFSIIHALGNIIIALSSFKDPILPAVAFTLVGLGLTAIGTGGIKPCVSAFGGDQFIIPGQERQLQQYFFVFYFSINLGSLISEFVTPILRRDVSCQGEDTCYPLAFGVPSILMLCALVIFILGKPMYKIKEPSGNVIVKVYRCISHAISNRNNNAKNETTTATTHWLDKAGDKFEPEFIEDVKSLFSILLLFAPLPIFWSLFEQQGSRWTFQASRMNGYVTDDFTIKPDQMQVINSVLCLALIPVLERIVYPLLGKCNILVNPLKRLSLGALLVAFSFIMAGCLELKMESTYAVIPEPMESNINFINTLPCNLTISLEKSIGGDDFYPPVHRIHPYGNFIYEKIRSWKYQFNSNPTDGECLVSGSSITFKPLEIHLYSEEATSVIITKSANNEISLMLDTGYDSLSKSAESNSKIRLVFGQLPPLIESVSLESTKKNYTINLPIGEFGTKSREIHPSNYSVHLNYVDKIQKQIGNIYVDQGGSYLLAIFQNYSSSEKSDTNDMMMRLYMLTQPNSIHMFYIIPQFVTITFGELLFAITGFDFSYSEAPQSMKAVIQSIWLFTIAGGNIIVVLVTILNVFGREATQFFSFAAMMFLGDLLFFWLACNYKIKNPRWNSSSTDPAENESSTQASQDANAKAK